MSGTFWGRKYKRLIRLSREQHTSAHFHECPYYKRWISCRTVCCMHVDILILELKSTSLRVYLPYPNNHSAWTSSLTSFYPAIIKLSSCILSACIPTRDGKALLM